MELPFAGLHQLCSPFLTGLERLPAPQRDALGTALGFSSGPAPDRFLVGVAVLSLLSDIENAGATEPRRLPDESENVRRSRYFFLAAFFLAGFLAAFFFAAMLVYLLHSISDPMNGFGGGSQMHSSTRSAGSSVGRFCDGNHEQHHFQTVVILEQDHFCQWNSHDGFTLTVKRSSSAWHHWETGVGGVQERGRAPHRP